MRIVDQFHPVRMSADSPHPSLAGLKRKAGIAQFRAELVIAEAAMRCAKTEAIEAYTQGRRRLARTQRLFDENPSRRWT